MGDGEAKEGAGMKLYQVTAQIVRVKDGWRSSTGVPTFYLRDDMQMIPFPSKAAAELAARSMILHIAADPSIEAVHIGIGESPEFDPAVIGA
mgnify:CR=1 FL=1